jgi:hypothetical protein
MIKLDNQWDRARVESLAGAPESLTLVFKAAMALLPT